MFKIIRRSYSNFTETNLTRDKILNLLNLEKKKSKITYNEIAKKINKTEVHVASIFHGQHPIDEEDFDKFYSLFLKNYPYKDHFKNVLTQIPLRGQNKNIFKDPTVYRLNEIVTVYGTSIKSLIEEKAGNGIMSAIDCKINVETKLDESNNKRIVLTIDGKFLEYKGLK